MLGNCAVERVRRLHSASPEPEQSSAGRGLISGQRGAQRLPSGDLFCSLARGGAAGNTQTGCESSAKIEQPSTRAFRGRCKERVPGCQVARRCDHSKIPRLDLGFKVPFVSVQSKCYEAGHQQRCAGHDEAHCHSGSSCMMQGSMRRAFLRRATGRFQGYSKKCGPSVRRQTARGRKKLQYSSLLSEALKMRRL